MGADYYWVAVELPDAAITRDHDSALFTIEPALVRAHFRYLASRLDAETRRDLLDNVFSIEGDETDTEVLAAYDESIEAVIGIIENRSRDAAYSSIGGTVFVHSGGPSWGDPPTDSFDHIRLLDELVWEVNR